MIFFELDSQLNKKSAAAATGDRIAYFLRCKHLLQRASGRKPSWLNYILCVPFIFFGPFSYLASARLFSEVVKNRQVDGYVVQRSLLLPLALFFGWIFKKKIFYVCHNIEGVYYYEEWKASPGFYSWCCLVQSIIFRMFENFLVSSAGHVYTLSEVDYRFYRSKGFIVEPISEHLFKYKSIDFVKAINRVWFGDLRNNRNIFYLNKFLQGSDEILDVYGRKGDTKLPCLIARAYKGEFSSLNDLIGRYHILVCPSKSRAGIQTKCLEWLEMGGQVLCSRRTKLQLPKAFWHGVIRDNNIL